MSHLKLLGKIFSVQLTSAATLTTLPYNAEYCLLLGSSHICLKGIQGEVRASLSSSDIKHTVLLRNK